MNASAEDLRIAGSSRDDNVGRPIIEQISGQQISIGVDQNALRGLPLSRVARDA